MNKKLAILAVFIAISIILGGYNSTILFGTQYLTTKTGYEFTVSATYDWWDCNWSYSKRITIHHEYIESDQTDFPVLIYNSSDNDLATYAQSDGDDILFTDVWNSTQYDHEIELFSGVTGQFVAWVEIPSLSSTEDTIFYMYYGNPDCSSQENMTGTWNSEYKMVQHLNEFPPGAAGVTHVDSTINYNNGTISGEVAQGSTEAGLPQMDGLDYFEDGSGYIDFGNDSSLAPSSLTLEAWVKDPPLLEEDFEKSESNLVIADKQHEYISLRPNEVFKTKRTIISDRPTEIIFAVLFSPGVLIQNMVVDNNSVLSGIFPAEKPRNKQELEIEKIRNNLPNQVRELVTVAYSHPIIIDKLTSVKMQFKTLGLNELFQNGKISYLVFSSDGRYDIECTTHWNSLLNIWEAPSYLYDFIRSLLGEDEVPPSGTDVEEPGLYVSSSIEAILEEYGNARVIIRFSDPQVSTFETTTYIEGLGFEKIADSNSMNLAAGSIDRAVFESLKENKDIEGIYLDKNYDVLLEESLPLINFDQAVQEFGLTGKEIKICMIDTGINSSIVDYSYGYDFVNDDFEPDDEHGHGTRVAAVLKRIAPDAELIVAKVIGFNGIGFESDVLEGLQYCIEQEPDIICFSIGSIGSCSGFCDTDLVAEMCNNAVDTGVFIVAASGNDGGNNLTSPACGSQVFSVGATNDNDDIASFTNINPTLDLLAPGVNITTIAGMSSGTSMSAPHVAAAAALVLENEDLTSSEIKYRLKSTGKPIGFEYNENLNVDICRLDVYNAVINKKTCEPYNYSNWWDCEIDSDPGEYITLTVATYYFDDWDETDEWEGNPQKMVDGDDKTYANTTINNDNELCTSNTATLISESQGDVITKVEIRAYGYKSAGANPDQVYLQPVFDGSKNGDEHIFINPVGEKNAAWSTWFDITTDKNAPSPWVWANITGLDCNVTAKVDTEITHFISKVELRVWHNTTPIYSGESPSNRINNVDWDITTLRVLIQDQEGDYFNWTIETSPNVGSAANTSGEASRLNGSKSCSISGLKPRTTYTWYVNSTDEGTDNWNNETYEFTTKQIELYNCSTNKSYYTSGDTVKFSAWVDALNGSNVTLLIANSIVNLNKCNYTNRSSCIANSSNISITTRPQQINATMISTGSTAWYAKICDDDENWNYIRENTSAWNLTYDSSGGTDEAKSVAIDDNSNIYVVGYGDDLNGSTNADWWIMRFNGTTGIRDWNKTYNGGNALGEDGALSVATDSNNVYIVGYGDDLNGSTNADWWIMRFNATTGNRDWNLTYDGNGSDDYAYGVAVDSNGHVYVVGQGFDVNGSGTQQDWWIMRFNSSTGVREWNKTYNYSLFECAYSVAIDTNDNVYVVGYFWVSGNFNDWWIKKFDSNGVENTTAWNKTFDGGSSDIAFSVSTDSSDNVYVTGQKSNDIWIKKFTSAGVEDTTNWNKTIDYGYDQVDRAYCVATESNNDVYIAGYGRNLLGTTYKDWLIKKFNATTGAEDESEWNKTYNANGSAYGEDIANSMAIDSEGNIYVVGIGDDLNGSTNGDVWIKKFEYFTGSFDATEPTIDFIDPTPYNNTHINDTWINVSLSTTDESQHYTFADFNNDLFLWMRMDEINGTGDPQELSIYENHGDSQSDAKQNESGYFGDGFEFDGSLDHIRISNLDNGGIDEGVLNYEKAEFTLSLWVKTSENNDPIVADWVTDSGGFPTNYFGWRLTTASAASVGALRYEVGSGGADTTFIDGSIIITDNNWTHIVVVDRGDSGDTGKNTSIYINGNLDIDAERGTKGLSGNRQFRIAGDYLIGLGSPKYIDGDIDEVLLFNRSLNLTEIKALYNASVNQYYRNFSGLTDGVNNFTGYAVDLGGNKNETENRTVTIDTIKPSVQFVDPTPVNGTITADTWINVNLSSSDTNQHYSFVDFNYDNVLWMRMDEINGTGDPQDLSSYNNHGEPGNADQTDDGFYGKGFSFDGVVSDMIVIDNDASLDFNDQGTYTWSSWIKLDAVDIDQWIIFSASLVASDNSGYMILVENDNTVSFAAFKALEPDLSANLVSSISTLSADIWYHIAAVFNTESDIKLYINGAEKASGSGNTNDITGQQTVISAGPVPYFTGTIDEVLIFNRSLSETEIKALYNASDNQYEHNFTGLSDGYYTFTGYDPDRGGNRNETEERNVTVDTTAPSISFVDPSPYNNTHRNYTWMNISLSTSDANQHYAFADFNNDLVLWMRMDDINGTWDPQDLSSYSNNGLKQNDANQTDDGYFGKAFEFDGTDDYINFSSYPIIASEDQYTISLWFKTTVGASAGGLYSEANNSDSENYIVVYQSGENLYFFVKNGTVQSNPGWDVNANDSNWHHVVAVKRASDAYELYHNGVHLGTGPTDVGIPSTNNVRVGSSNQGGTLYNFTGTIDDLVVFKRAINLSEIQALYNASVNQYYCNHTDLSDGVHNFSGYAVDKSANKNETETRNATVDTINASVQFIDPTPANNTHRNKTWFIVNLSSSDTNQHYTFTDFDYDNVLWMRMDDTSESYYINEDDTEDSAYYTGAWSGTAGGGYDENWGTFMAAEDEGGCAIYINYTIPANVSSVINEIKYSKADDEAVDLDVYGYNSSSSTYEFIVSLEAGNQNYTNVTIPSWCLGDTGDTLYMKYLANGGGGQPVFYEEKMKWNISDITVNDLSSYGNNGTRYDATQTTDGFYGKAFTFDGDDDYIDLGTTNLVTQYDNFTISIWAKLNATTGSMTIYSEGNSGTTSGFYINAVANTGFIWVTGIGAGGIVLFGDADMDDGEWHHITFTKNNNDFKLYNNGNIIDSDTDTYGTPSINNVRIGDFHISGAHSYFIGEIDDVLGFKRALDQTEIRALYDASTYQYERNFTSLSDGYHTFTGYDPDRGGNRNETEERNVTIDTIKPSIEFIPPTPSNGSQAEDYIYVNISSSDTNQHYTFTDFNLDVVLWMRMDEINGTDDPQDLSSYENNGIARGNTNQTDNGFYGKAWEFDGDTDYITIDDDGTSLDFDDQGTYTWSMWAKLEEIDTEQYLLKKESQPAIIALGYFILVKGDNTVSLAKKNPMGAGLLYQVTTTKTLDADQFYHIAITFNTESDIKIYIDGVENVSGSGAFDDETNTDIFMGATGGTALNGTLDDVLIFKRNLSATEIKALYNATDNQYEHNFTGLSLGNYTFTGYDPDRAGNRNQTEPRWRDYSNTPIVITNDTTGVEEGNATLWGYLEFDGGEDCTVRFEYGLTTAYGTNTTNQTKSGGQEFSGTPIAVLDPGTLYYYRAFANNTQGADVGAMDAFLTKPLLPMGLNATTYNQTCINLTWTKGQGANNTYIMRKYGSFPTSQNDGINIYNSTGTSYNDTGLDQKTRYYYRAWSYTNWSWIEEVGAPRTEQQWSDSYANATNATETLRLISCSTDKSIYGDGDTVTFTAWVDADIGSSVILLIANSTSNLDNCTYTDQDSCVPGLTTSTTPITSQPQSIAAAMTADSNTTWYAKVCDSENRSSYTKENTTAWDKTYHMDSDYAESVAKDSNDNVYIVGMGENLNGTSSYDWWIMKFNSTGDREWNKTYDDGGGGSSKESAHSVAVDSNDNVYVVGCGYKLNGTKTDHDWWIMRFNATTGNRDWNKTYDSGGDDSNDIAQEVAVDTVDNVYVVGHGTNLNDTTNMDWWIMRFNATTGNRDWNKTYSSGGNNQDVAYSVTTDSNDDVYVVGYGKNLNDTTNNDWWIMKFNSSTGNRDWNKTYDSGSNDIDIAQSVVVDSNDNVYVVGNGDDLNGSTSYDWWIMRFDATTGNRDWNKTYDGGNGLPDIAYSVAVDSNDNVYVVGYGDDLNGSTDYDWWIKRFNSTGSQDVWNWNLTYDGNAGQDYPRSVAVDSNESVYIVGTGTDLNGSTNYDWWIKKFEYFTGNFTVLYQNKEIIKMSQNTYNLEISSNGTVLYGRIGTTVINAPIDTDWHYVALTYDTTYTNISLYKDGVLVNYTDVMVAWSYPGTLPNVTSGKYLTGHLDELRISSTARSSSWINTSYQNMNAPTSFATFEDPIGVLTTWTYRKKITINGSLVTGSVATHANFPVLIYNNSDSNLSDNALSTGNDIIFLNSSVDWTTGTWRDKLDHEIEKYTNSTGELVAWVRIPSLAVGSDTEIYMYYGNTLCTTNRENITGVWNSNYTLVQHLNESSGTLLDSTSNNNDGTNIDNNATYNASSKIDGGHDFHNNYNSTVELDPNFGGLSQITVEAWVYTPSQGKYRVVAMSGVYDGTRDWILQMNNLDPPNSKMRFKICHSGGDDNYPDTIAVPLNEWTYYVGTWKNVGSGHQGKFYRNGILRHDSGMIFESITMNDASNNASIGSAFKVDGSRSRFYNGTIDEVRISNIVRSDGWINTSYNNVNDTTNFSTFGAQEKRNIAPVQSNPIPADAAKDQSLNPTLWITVNDTNADAMNVTFRTNATGSWGEIDSNNTVYNGTYSQTNSSMDSYSTKYWWSVNLTDGTLWTNRTYNFTTQAPKYKTFYFMSWDAAEEWQTNPSYMVDGNSSNYSSTTSSKDVELCTNNNYTEQSGTITKVEIRAFGYRSGGGVGDYIILRPVFDGSKDGDDHNWVIVGVGWSQWFDITTDTNASSPWTWDNVSNLDCDVESALATEVTLYCSKVEVRATYYT